MNWTESNIALKALSLKFIALPLRTKDNLAEYEALAKPLRVEANILHYTRISLCRAKQYE